MDDLAKRTPIALACAVMCALAGTNARADGLRVHGLGGVTLPLGEPQSKEYGVGGGGAIALELPIAAVLGVQAEAGALAQSKAARPDDPTIADHGAGRAIFGALGARLRPFGGGGNVAGPWLDANFGLTQTGDATRPVFDAHLGHDLRVGSGRLDVGPFVGYTQIFQPDASLRPEDAHVVWLGVHIGLGAPRPAPAPVAAKTEPPPVPPPPPPPPGEKTEPRADRDNDTVFDDEDACPDVPGMRTGDPKTNGCPPQGEGVRIEGATIVLDDIIHFDIDSPRVRRVSWPIVKHVADFINANGDVLEVEIDGHADLMGTAAHNQRLSEARAESVKQLLVYYGVDARKLTLRGHGFNQPRAIGYTEREYRQNRRVEFTIVRARPATSAPEAAPREKGAQL